MNEASQAVAVYMRVSSEDQRRRGTIDTQRPDLDRYISAYGLVPYGWYQDEAVSGRWISFAERPQGRRLVADVKAGHIGLVLCWRLDRFGRNAREIHNAVHDLEACGAYLVSVRDGVDTRTPTGRLMMGILASIAEYEWESIHERTEAGKTRRLGKDTGWMGGFAPYGYKVIGKLETAHLEVDTEPLGISEHPDMSAADVVRLIFGMSLDENLTCVAIGDRLTAMHVPTAYVRRGMRYKRGERDEPTMGIWRSRTVYAILANPIYKGVYIFGRRTEQGHKGQSNGGTPRELVTATAPAIVPAEVWDTTQAKLEQRFLHAFRNGHRDYLLRGLMTCGLCGHKYLGDQPGKDRRGNDRPARYVCYAARYPTLLYGTALAAESRCTALPVSVSIEDEVWADVEDAIRNPGPTLAKLHAKLTGQADQSADIRAQLAAKQQEQAKKQEERDLIWTQFRTGSGVMTQTDLDHQLAQIAQEQVKLAKDVAELNSQLATAEEVAAKVGAAAALLEQLRGKLDSSPPKPALRRSIVETLVSKITVRPNTDEETGEPYAEVRVTYCYEPAESDGVIMRCSMGGAA